ncbi:MAG: hypothetical protein PHE86_03930 [Candidatus Marinimicrobia bacterium]|nr:hypothetical protein [Candidatus Neomarinimicrobiota bacterium]
MKTILKKTLYLSLILCLNLQCLLGQSYEEIKYLPDTIRWKNYTFKKVSDDGHVWYAILLKSQDTLALFNQGFHRQMTQSAFLPIPHNEDSMFMVEQFSGGAHCCWTYTIFDMVGDSLRLFFKSSDYPVGYPVKIQDLNDDGIAEWIQSLLTFDYFLILSHAVSPLIPIIFRYDTNGFYPANPEFKEILLQDIHAPYQILQNSSPLYKPIEGSSPDVDLFSQLMEVVITLFYSGEYAKARSVFYKYYTAPDA